MTPWRHLTPFQKAPQAAAKVTKEPLSFDGVHQKYGCISGTKGQDKPPGTGPTDISKPLAGPMTAIAQPSSDAHLNLPQTAVRYKAVRALSERLATPLSAEDQCVQSMPDASPTKWHLAHTTWFFETILLVPHLPGYKPFDESFFYLFNSYYESLGPRHPRPQRGLLTRPSHDQVMDYRRHVDAAMANLLASAAPGVALKIAPLVELGWNHEQQHQELLLTDIKHAFSCNPLLPAYLPRAEDDSPEAMPARWIEGPHHIVEVGHHGADGFAFDNETPRHPVLLQPYRIADRLVTNGDYRAFIADGGYKRPEFWLSDGWATVQAQSWQAPGYWQREAEDAPWHVFTLHGLRRLDESEPVAHVSFFEAAAYAAWAGKRLPTEFEWEATAAKGMSGRDLDPTRPHPRALIGGADNPEGGLRQATGEVWQWTRSSYDPYPGFKPLGGALAEYNGKFMVGQVILRGGSCVTPEGHTRPSYRNFFPPSARWQFSGIRLAEDL